MRLSLNVRHQILQYKAQGLSCLNIKRALEKCHGVKTSRVSVWKFIKKFTETESIHDKSRKVDNRLKIRPVHRRLIDFWLKENSEMNSTAIRQKLLFHFKINISKSYVCQIRRSLGWRTQRCKYCQLISHVNRRKRVDYALWALRTRETFLNVIFVDESSVEMSADGKIYFYKPTDGMQYIESRRQKPKHAYKVHVWAGISYRGRTHICIFNGIMDSCISDGYRLYQDNDSKHCSKSTKAWMTDNHMIDNVMKTPASSPDLNPIENVWSSLKQYLQNVAKPRKRDELVNGIVDFWEGLSANQCGRYIDHIHRVIPHVILNEGGPTMF
ncbi:unnamed protein product [Mytilus edulis]|uniref:Tc1-like transposase DDE domain-containing protein n=1 Tax=Mytilus edulis TaxID=6550 RepID=A0A8S3UED0_MYTED|nr:unnamed protein product [Mytilus edulis]